jgi:hypothetical protein
MIQALMFRTKNSCGLCPIALEEVDERNHRKRTCCKSKDSLLEVCPAKKLKPILKQLKDPFIYNYILLVNDKMYFLPLLHPSS